MTVTTVLSDLGNVVAMYELRCFVETFRPLPQVGALLPTPELSADLARLQALEDDMWALVHRFELGQTDEAGFIADVSRRFGLETDIPAADVHRLFGDIFTLNAEVAVLWQRLRQKRGITLVAVSNLCPIHERYIRRIGAMEPFDHLLLSCYEGVRKPSAEFIIRALDRAGSAAEQAVFIDDLEENLEPAAALGVPTHCYRTFEGLCGFLAGNGLIIDS